MTSGRRDVYLEFRRYSYSAAEEYEKKGVTEKCYLKPAFRIRNRGEGESFCYVNSMNSLNNGPASRKFRGSKMLVIPTEYSRGA